ncbi:hypothetical protein KC821_02955 [Proteus vulgaris]|uniref:Alpha/beta hydrolase n=1 Tax=Proteus vulgaris TaxID=585 RepID=A0A379F624_PROVU|nr:MULTISPECIES: hypothetical protein [Proteus]AYY79982.1 hypothetical protein EGX81_03495 [Proteus vulgaris]MBG5971033.1 hypothetical protein [Proteus vulgaris]MBI6510367.1 hypothetical protein [Proteus sp. PR00174]MDM3559737.1 hypothetical protein [Proteus vulgaris]SUC14793.1 Uncharacterised protein [Proteus vulgaris]
MALFNHQQGKTLLINNADIYIETLGNPKNYPIILLHGGMGNLTSFNPLVDYLKDYYLIVICWCYRISFITKCAFYFT